MAFHEIRTNRPDTFMASIMQVLTTPGGKFHLPIFRPYLCSHVHAAPMEARLQCAVLLRKYVGSGKDSLWSKLNEQMKNEVCSVSFWQVLHSGLTARRFAAEIKDASVAAIRERRRYFGESLQRSFCSDFASAP